MHSRLTHHVVRSLILTAVCFSTTALRAADPPQGPIDDDWFVVKMQGVKCGYAHSTTRREGDAIDSKLLMVIEIARGQAKARMTIEQSYHESLKGEPLSFRNVQSLGEVPQTTSGTVEGSKVRLVTEQLGGRQEKVYPWDPEVKFTWGQLLEQRERGLKPGTHFKVKTYEPTLRPDAPVETAFDVIGPEHVDVLGKPRDLVHVRATLKLQSDKVPLPSEIASDTWVDQESRPVVTTVDMGMLKLNMYLADRETAMAGGAPPEMFFDTLITMKSRIPADAREVKLRLKLPPDSGATLPTLPNTGMQTFKRVNDREGILTIRRLDWKAIRAAGDQPASDEMKDYLRASSTLDTNDAKIRRLARQAVRGHSTPAEKADALRSFVTDYITDKNMNVGFATAVEVARNRRGDCTEHGVLLAALARAAGLPARGVSGMVGVSTGPLAPPNGVAFGYHMWTQVNIDGRWVDIDAAMRQTDCDPTHIALSLMPLNEEGMLDPVVSLMPLIGRLKIELIEAK